MNRKLALVAACTTLTMISGTAFGAQTNNYPDGIASQNELDLQDIARTMINSLTPDQQNAIASNGGIGSDALNLDGFTRNYDARMEASIPAGVSAAEYLGMLLSDDIRSELSEQELSVINTITAMLDEGKELPFMCFAPDTNPKYAWLINEMLDYQFVSEDGSRFQQGNRWTRTATDGSGLPQGHPSTITYSFVPDGTFIPNAGLGSGNSTLFQWLNGIYGNTSTWQSLFHQVFDRWGELTGVTYVWEQTDTGTSLNGAQGVLGQRGDVRIAAFNYPADGNFGVLAYNFFPNDGDMAIDAFDSFYNNTGSNSLRLRNVVAHEHGHGLGMEHVCPSNQTKLMEPFVSTAYNGPQLDDILNGQRHYGDPLEPNDSTSDATEMGTFGSTGFFNITEASIDDNSDIDFFHITLTDRAKITFAISPNAGQYQQGPQTNACNTGTNTNYNIIHDLRIDIFESSDLISPVASVNATSFGSGETLVYDSETSSGEYYIVVSPVTTRNSVQRYQGSMFVTALPPVVCPADLNDDGDLNFFDVSAFLNAFNAGLPDGDFDDNGEFNFFDVSAFLNAFSAGCP